jgi:hypothetical protein
MYYLIQSSRRGEQVLLTGDLAKLERLVERLQRKQPHLSFRVADQPPGATNPPHNRSLLQGTNLPALP